VRRGGPRLSHELTDEEIEGARRFALWLAGRWGKGKRAEVIEEIVSAAWLALVEAAARHDPARGDFAAYWPTCVKWRAFSAAFGRDLSVSARELATRSFSLDKPLRGMEDRTLGDMLPARAPSPRDRAEVIEAARRVIDSARPGERRALELVGRGFNVSEAARDSGVSRHTVENWIARLRGELAPAFGEDLQVAKAGQVAKGKKAGRAPKTDTLHARAFVLQDAKGRTRAALEVADSGTVGLRVFDAAGRVRLLAGVQDGDPGLALLDEDGRERVVVCLHHGEPELALRDADGNPVPVAGADPWLAREAAEADLVDELPESAESPEPSARSA